MVDRCPPFGKLVTGIEHDVLGNTKRRKRLVNLINFSKSTMAWPKGFTINDQQLNIRIRSLIPPSTRTEQVNPLWVHFPHDSLHHLSKNLVADSNHNCI